MGGAINSATVDCRNCTFESNAAYDGSGGAISACQIKTFDCSFSRNAAQHDGGAIYVANRGWENYMVDIEICSFSSNTAGTHGGAIRFGHIGTTKAGDLSRCIVKNNTFTKNWAKDGSAIYYVEKQNISNDDIANKWGNTGKDNNSSANKDNYWGIY